MSLKALQLAFSNHKYWNEINNSKSELCKFLLDVCKADQDEIESCVRDVENEKNEKIGMRFTYVRREDLY